MAESGDLGIQITPSEQYNPSSITQASIPPETHRDIVLGLKTPLREFVGTVEARVMQMRLDRVLERRGLDRSALAYIREWIDFPDLILTPTNSEFKKNFLAGFIGAIAPGTTIKVAGIKVFSNVHEQPLGPETEEGAKNRLANAIQKAASGDTGDPALNELIKQGKRLGFVGAIENGMVEGEIDSDNNVHLYLAKREYDQRAEHFDVAYAILQFPPDAPITVSSPREEAVRFDPRDANESAKSGFAITAGQKMQERLKESNIIIDKQNWHGYAITQEIEQANALQAQQKSPGVLHTEAFAGFDRNEQLTGVLFDAFYALAQKREAAEKAAQSSSETQT